MTFKYVILDTSMNQVHDIDDYQSIIWTDRYYTCGDFELKLAFHVDLLDIYVQGYYIWSNLSDRLMVIEEIELDTDIETGSVMTIRGRSIESILDRRIIWNLTVLVSNWQTGVYTLLDENVINPADTARKLPNITFINNEDVRFNDITIDAQYFGENLYDTIVSLCEVNKVGWKIVPIFDETDTFITFMFYLYFGEDRSYDSVDNSPVIFSESNDNILSSTYLESKKIYKNAALIGGEGEGSAKKTASVVDDSLTNMDRRELYVTASDISTDAGATMSASDYTAQLEQRGREELEEYPVVVLFDGEVDALSLYRYNRDFFMGDIVETVNVYNQSGKSQITEFIISIDESGYTTYPTFVFIE